MTIGPHFNNALWRKGGRSEATANCIEVATVNGVIGVRDSKNPGKAVLASSSCQWESFMQSVKQGKFDM